MIDRIDHIGIAVPDIEAALRLYRDGLGLSLEQVEDVAGQKIRSHHLRIGGSQIELLTPTDPTSVIAKFLERTGGGIHHIALAAKAFDAARDRLVAAGCEPIGPPSTGAGGKRIQFFHPRTTGGVLLELSDSTE